MHRISAQVLLRWRGYEGRCSCGWRGPRRLDQAAALGDARLHREAAVNGS